MAYYRGLGPELNPPEWGLVDTSVENKGPSPVGIHLLALHDEGATVVRRSAENHGAQLGRLLQLDVDIRTWEHRLSIRPEVSQLATARRELGFAIYAVSTGLYVHGYAGLRLFLELSFAAVYFSANELHRRRWLNNRADFSWSTALDENQGVLAPSFVREFCAGGASQAPEYAAQAANCYRHCSQFLHGKDASTKLLPQTLSYSSDVLADWLTSAISGATAVLYLLYARYGDELLGHDSDGALGATLESSFSHLPEIRMILGLPVEQG